MIPAGYTLRDVYHDDFDRIAELTNRIEQEKISADDLRSRWLNKKRKQWRAILEKDGEMVGYAHCLQAITGGGGIYLIRVDIEDEHRHQGLGRALLAMAEQFGRESEAELLTSKSRDDMEREKRFFEAAGYDAFEHIQGVTLDLSDWQAPVVSPGVERILSWAEIGDLPENRRRLYEFYTGTEEGSPGIEVWGIPDFENWQTGIFTSSWFMPDGLLVAELDGEWVGMTILGPMGDGIWTTDYTGVVPAARGKGIATRLKVAALSMAKANGGTALHTFNDALNGPMRAINDKLGFIADTGWWMHRKRP